MNSTKNLSQCNGSTVHDLNRVPLKYEARMPTSRLPVLILCIWRTAYKTSELRSNCSVPFVPRRKQLCFTFSAPLFVTGFYNATYYRWHVQGHWERLCISQLQSLDGTFLNPQLTESSFRFEPLISNLDTCATTKIFIPSLRSTSFSSPRFDIYGDQSDHTPSSVAKIKNVWFYTSAPPYIFVVWCLMKHRHNLASDDDDGTEQIWRGRGTRTQSGMREYFLGTWHLVS